MSLSRRGGTGRLYSKGISELAVLHPLCYRLRWGDGDGVGVERWAVHLLHGTLFLRDGLRFFLNHPRWQRGALLAVPYRWGATTLASLCICYRESLATARIFALDRRLWHCMKDMCCHADCFPAVAFRVRFMLSRRTRCIAAIEPKFRSLHDQGTFYLLPILHQALLPFLFVGLF
ncbi:hypothetical protein BDQ17DRAFT_757743 [Cyathus striatus]|nr:hypothetical protein BDQ17DRAFT_757743 [Cyathus striatus]